MRAFVLAASPRRDGNSARLAEEIVRGLAEAGHEADFVFADDILGGFLGDCRRCRRRDGECAIDDGYRSAFFQQFLPADGFIAATPVYWYGMSAQLKAFFDRMFCYVAASHPCADEIVSRLMGKRIGLALASEETYPTVTAGIVHQVQEYARYTNSTFVGTMHGRGNARGEVAQDPANPLAAARFFGRSFFTAHASDYRIDTPRPGRVWQGAGAASR